MLTSSFVDASIGGVTSFDELSVTMHSLLQGSPRSLPAHRFEESARVQQLRLRVLAGDGMARRPLKQLLRFERRRWLGNWFMQRSLATAPSASQVCVHQLGHASWAPTPDRTLWPTFMQAWA
eukprot:3002799-Amphidinium_carterae.1